MQLSAIRRRLAGLIVGALVAAAPLSAAHAGCEFAVVKQAIDIILDQDAEKGAKFRAEVKSGSDSTAMIEALVSPEMQEKVDICRYEVGEYLTKRGYPPFH